MPRIFISYRRSDSIGTAGRISDRLSAKFGSGSIFVDIDKIPFGSNFISAVTEELRQCDVFLAIIGTNWFAGSSSQRSRIENESDFVRLEIEAALNLRKPIIPVLIGGARMPSPKDLPGSLRDLAYRHATYVDDGSDFHRDVDRLIRAIEFLVDRTSDQEFKRPSPDIGPTDVAVNQVFISHATEDRVWVESQIISPLNTNGIKTWYSTRSISSAAQWEREILKGLEACDWFLIVVSLASSKSEWVKDELFWAMIHRPTRIVPAIYQMCDLWTFHIRLPRLQYIDFTTDTSSHEKLLSAFNG